MSDATDDPDSVPPSDVFGLLANDTRLSIIEALAEAPSDGYPSGGYSPALSFSALRNAVGMADSGQFNYHLGQLVGRFVSETDEGYTLTYTGGLLYRTLVAGFFNQSVEVEPFETSSRCADCGATLVASFESTTLDVTCPDCGREFMNWQFPPAGTRARDGENLLSAYDQYLRHHIMLASRGICIWCAGHMPPELHLQENTNVTGANQRLVFVSRRCENCRGILFTRPGESLLYHPAVVSFFYERGVDVTEEYLWDLDFVVDPAVTTVRSEDPWRVAVTVACAGDERTLVLDGTAEVVAVEG